MKVYAVVKYWNTYDVDCTEILKVFIKQTDANNFHEELVSNRDNKWDKYYVEEIEVIE
jgi:hypothetical protein